MMTENQVTVLACLFTDKFFFSTNVLIVVRYLVSQIRRWGLIAAIKTTAQMVLETCDYRKTIDIHFIITFDYVNKVMRIIKEKS
jgi:uncharacterized membrane protein YoaT (DUF817 family)